MRANQLNKLDPQSLQNFIPDENIFFQFWTTYGTLVISRPGGEVLPLDPVSLREYRMEYTTAQGIKGPIRVLNAPVISSKGQVGILQISESLELVNYVQSMFGIIFFVITTIGCLIFAALAWIFTGQTLAPLYTATRVADRLTKTDDLQRRIPYIGRQHDEVGVLINSFNQTLDRLEQLFDTQRRFLADISHELRTPLTVIKGNVGLMQQMHNADSESLEGINQEVDRLTRLVGDLLVLAQAETGHLPMRITPVALDSILMDVFHQMKTMAGEKVDLRLGDFEQIEVMGDEDRLKQMMLNIITNAIQHTQQDGRVEVILRRFENWAHFIVTDNGPGISPEDLPHIFERFYRAEKSRKRKQYGGFGLGLSIAYWIVNNHNGKIEVSSREGRGTTFMVWLPLRIRKISIPDAEKNPVVDDKFSEKDNH